MSGAFLHDSTYINNRIASDAEYKGELIYSQISQDMGSLKRFRNYDTCSDDSSNIGYPLTSIHIASLLERGFPLIHMDTHGNDCEWSFQWDENIVDTFTCNHASSFSNPSHSIIVTSACHTNAFDHTSSLSQSFVNNPNGGIVGYFGSSRQGWCDTNPLRFGPSDNFNIAFYKAIIDSADVGNHFAEAATIAKVCNISEDNMPYTNAHRWLLYTINPIGDPEMPIYVRKPIKLDYIDVYYRPMDNILEIDFNDIHEPERRENSQVCIMSLDDEGESCYMRYKAEDMSYYECAIPPRNCSVCITKPGCIPLCFYLYNSGNIQNELIKGPAFCLSSDVHIGKNVTSIKPQGAVSLEQGQMEILCPDGATIHDSFDVKIGCNLNITPDSGSRITLISSVPEE